VRDVCEQCNAFLHCCRNCEFYERGAHNDCREANAEMVADKESGNFCDFFRLSSASRGGNRDQPERSATPSSRSASEARSKLEALFGKKSTREFDGG
jgi:hypothetical protein